MIDVRAADERDKDQVLGLLQEVFGAEEAQRAERRWHWQWHQDPRLETPGYKGVVTEWRGRLIGNMSCIPAGLHLDGHPVTGSWGVDLLVHWGLVRRALKDQKRSPRSDGPDLSHGIACAMLDHPAMGQVQLGKHIARKLVPIGTRIGFEIVPDTGRWARRISLKGRTEAFLGRPLGTAVGAAADLALGRIPRPSLAVKPFEADFDARFDRLWEEVKADYPAITLRDSTTLNWRYRRHPDIEYQTLVLEEGDGLRGYLVFSEQQRGVRRRAKVVDVLARAGDSEALESLVAAALRRFRRDGMDRAECFACGAALNTAVERAGFRLRLKDDKVEPVWARGLPDGLYATDGDGDGA